MDFHMKNHLPSIIIHLSNSFSKTISSSSLLHFQSALLVVLSLSFCTPRSRLCWLRKLRSASCRGTALSLTCDAIHHGIVKANLSCSCRLLRELTLVPLVLWGLGSLQSPSCQNHRLVGLDWKEFTVSPQERKKKKNIAYQKKTSLKWLGKPLIPFWSALLGPNPLLFWWLRGSWSHAPILLMSHHPIWHRVSWHVSSARFRTRWTWQPWLWSSKVEMLFFGGGVGNFFP